MMDGIGERLKNIRIAVGDDQKSMARRFGLGDTTWQRLELESRAPKDEVLAQLINLGFSVDWLLSGVGNMRREQQPKESPPLDEELLKQSLHLVEDWLAENRRVMAPDRKAAVVAEIYAFIRDEEAEGKSISPKNMGRVLKLVVG
jgi:transcriptional regulator with XRE-family HTH domain